MKKPVLFIFSILILWALYFVLKNPNLLQRQQGERPKGALTMSESDFRDKLAEFRMERDKLERHIKQLEEKKAENLKVLKDLNVTKVADAKGKPDAEIALKGLSENTKKIADLGTQFEKYDTTISRISGMLDKLERDRIHSEVKLTEEQEVEILALVRGLDERLELGKNDPLEDEALDELLKSESEKN